MCKMTINEHFDTISDILMTNRAKKLGAIYDFKQKNATQNT